MRITVYIKPGAKQAKIEEIDEGNFRVWVHARPEAGKANAEMIELLADHFHVAKLSVRIIIGKTSREKLVEINT